MTSGSPDHSSRDRIQRSLVQTPYPSCQLEARFPVRGSRYFGGRKLKLERDEVCPAVDCPTVSDECPSGGTAGGWRPATICSGRVGNQDPMVPHRGWDEVSDIEAATALTLEQALALDESIELDSKIAVDVGSAMPEILKAQEHVNG